MRRTAALAALAMLAACQGEPVASPAADPVAATPSSDVSPALAGEMVEQKRVPAGACAADEMPIFTCKFADGKRVAVCGAGEWHGRYRYGGSTSELELEGGKYAHAMYSGGGESQIAFDNGDTRYVIFSRMVRTGFGEEGNNPAISDGIVIERAGKFQSIRICDDPDLKPIDMNAANAIWEDEGELFTEETIRADPFGNE
ncbi:hypothetical protein [Porphyrobacter sp. ULC335]|uniref:hypothetical protein n=1 Tax=Porphyrobacter sp. ULC335 TaxID=2854260 RepID=UPI00222101A0|nr:hypothetical protein [Porphyrobacter sp. ULC335]UYV15291.1 hypothetical protein KVF90_14375 [Porphyrobacter sp. ULC335]